MFAIQCIDHIVLKTTNLEEMLNFYCDILGCKFERQVASVGLTQLRAGDSMIDLLQVESRESGQNIEHFCLRISPFDYASLEKYFHDKNIAIYNYGKRYGAQGTGESFYLKDPENNEIELKKQIDN